MASITGNWSAFGTIVTTLITGGNARYKAYFSVPSEVVDEAQMLERFKFYGDSNNNGVYDADDLFISTVLVRSFGNLGDLTGKFISQPGTNTATSYIDGIAVGVATFELSAPWEGVGGFASGSNILNTPQTLSTTSSVDNLTGIKKSRDIFKFDADPSGQIDSITGFRAKDKDVISISETAFGIDDGTFAIAKNLKALDKQLSTDVDIIYYRKTGELILNSNGSEPGFGDNGGVFAVLAGRPTLNLGSVEFY